MSRTVTGTGPGEPAAYGTMVHPVSVGGGWLADRIPGSYRAVLCGGVPLARRHCARAVPTSAATRAGPGVTAPAPWLRRTMHPVH
ncbi:hypothetical protein [Streptomyces bambusae]|uniref:hypothetical protein n=1 Tax=Streptomyces bambusae TaxID=1550616 RepID=UPI003FD858C1